MSKLLKQTIRAYRPSIAARMTKANGYDPKKHLHAKDLHQAGIINDGELADILGCVDDLASTGSAKAGALKAAQEGKLSPEKLNDDQFIKDLMAVDSDTDEDGDDDGFDGDDAVEDIEAKAQAATKVKA